MTIYFSQPNRHPSSRPQSLTQRLNALLFVSPITDVRCPLCQQARSQEMTGKTDSGVPCCHCQACGCHYTCEPVSARQAEVRELFAHCA